MLIDMSQEDIFGFSTYHCQNKFQQVSKPSVTKHPVITLPKLKTRVTENEGCTSVKKRKTKNLQPMFFMFVTFLYTQNFLCAANREK